MKKKSNGYVSFELVIFLVLLAAVVLVLLLIQSTVLRMALLAIILVGAILYFIISTLNKQRWFYNAAQILTNCSERIDKYVNAVTIPTAITRENGTVGWHNPAFFMLAGMHCEGKNIYHIFPQLLKPEPDRKVRIQGKTYLKEEILSSLGGRKYTVHRLIDVTKTYEASVLSRTVMATICHIQVDNYGDMLRATEQSLHAEINAEIERIISRCTANLHGTYQKYDRDKYFLVFERRFLSPLMQSKFSILNEIRGIDTGNNAFRPTISIGAGIGTSPAEANGNAVAALELALARGGDQAVLKDETGQKFYGGIQQGMEKRTRVKSRMFARALKNLMEQTDKVIIMGHSVPDLDCMGAAMGLLACANEAGKKAYIVLDKSNGAIQGLVDEMKRDPYYNGVLVSPSEAMGLMDKQTMLIVVDTQIANFTIAPQLLPKAKTLVVIDHHLRGTDHINNPTLFLHEPYASSTAEMVTEILQYFADKMPVRQLEVEALLAGITIDTKGFSFKTGVRTFEAASYLRKLGADTTSIRHLFQDDLETFSTRAKVVQNAKVVADGIAISWCPDDIKNPQLLAAQAADALIGIRGINASFVMCEQNGTVLISGRSIGGVNVQRILEKLGGGGHATIAGAQMKGVDKETAEQKLAEAIEEYKKES
ncbi:MAG: DHH family phosphoesterase [Christensenella sp.]|nr:DHH family phosphoesterase [Christensenella sp.]